MAYFQNPPAVENDQHGLNLEKCLLLCNDLLWKRFICAFSLCPVEIQVGSHFTTDQACHPKVIDDAQGVECTDVLNTVVPALTARVCANCGITDDDYEQQPHIVIPPILVPIEPEIVAEPIEPEIVAEPIEPEIVAEPILEPIVPEIVAEPIVERIQPEVEAVPVLETIVVSSDEGGADAEGNHGVTRTADEEGTNCVAMAADVADDEGNPGGARPAARVHRRPRWRAGVIKFGKCVCEA
eukprot:3531071-Amphidinium_carterae.2